jgi:hypothetical protein
MIILDTIHRHVFYIKHNVLDTGFCASLQVERTHLGREIETSTNYLEELHCFHLKAGAEFSLQNVVLNKTHDNG